jgi:hypothetical protein
MAIQYGDPMPHPTQKCKNCGGRIMVRAQWEDGDNWGGTEAPTADDRYCEKGCPPTQSGAYDRA